MDEKKFPNAEDDDKVWLAAVDREKLKGDIETGIAISMLLMPVYLIVFALIL